MTCLYVGKAGHWLVEKLFLSFLSFSFGLVGHYDHPVEHPIFESSLSAAFAFQSGSPFSDSTFLFTASSHLTSRSFKRPFSLWILWHYRVQYSGFWLRQACSAHCNLLLWIVSNMLGPSSSLFFFLYSSSGSFVGFYRTKNLS